jgi:hypothetical protein
MIEKKIFYNEPKPTKVSNIKPVMQGGKLNYLGKQKTITAPVKWKSGPTHPITHLAYISDEEQKVLVKLNMYKSMNGKPNKGPFGIVSLNDGDGSGGDSGGASGGSGGSDAAGDAGDATGDSAGVGGSGDSTDGAGAGSGPGGESGTGGVGGEVGGIGGSETGFGIGPDDAVDTSISQPAESIDVDAPEEETGIMGALKGYVRDVIANPVPTLMGLVNPVLGIAVRAYDNYARGVTAPNDYSQLSTSVQTSTPGPNNSGGVNTINQYAPLYNTTTGDNTADAMRARLNALIQEPQPTVYGLPSINPYSNYTLLDLKNLRR